MGVSPHHFLLLGSSGLDGASSLGEIGKLPITLPRDPGNGCELPLGWSRQQRARAGAALPSQRFRNFLWQNVFVFPLVP